MVGAGFLGDAFSLPFFASDGPSFQLVFQNAPKWPCTSVSNCQWLTPQMSTPVYRRHLGTRRRSQWTQITRYGGVWTLRATTLPGSTQQLQAADHQCLPGLIHWWTLRTTPKPRAHRRTRAWIQGPTGTAQVSHGVHRLPREGAQAQATTPLGGLRPRKPSTNRAPLTRRHDSILRYIAAGSPKLALTATPHQATYEDIAPAGPGRRLQAGARRTGRSTGSWRQPWR